MFLWLNLNYSTNPLFTSAQQSPLDFEKGLWQRLISGGVIVGPGWYYAPLTRSSSEIVGEKRDNETIWGHTRLSFSYESKEGIERAIERFAKVMLAEWAGETSL